MERVPTDADDRPKTDIRITGATVFVNPYKDEEEAERKAADAERAKVREACVPRLVMCKRRGKRRAQHLLLIHFTDCFHRMRLC